MAIQTYVKLGSGYTAGINFSAADADLSAPNYQVYVSAQHDWGYPLFERARVTTPVASGDTIIPVDDSSGFSAGDKIIFQDGTEDFKTIDSVTAESIILTQALPRGHSAGTQVGLEVLATRVSANNYQYAFSADDLKSSGVHGCHGGR